MAAKKKEDETEAKTATAETADAGAAAPAKPKAKVPLPQSIKMVKPHGFIDDKGKHRYWQQGQVVFEPDDIAVLVERKATFEVVEP